MGTFWFGFKALFRIWRDEEFARQVHELFGRESAPQPRVDDAGPVSSQGSGEALALLATLQREARFIDFIKEPIAGFTDAQIGAAVRTVHNECAATIDRYFAIEPLRTELEGSEISVPPDFNPSEWRLTGNIPERAPFRGRLRHPGWKAVHREPLPVRRDINSARVVAPCEVEIA